MFGLGKIVGGIVGHIPGLNKIAPFISIAVDAFSGNWAGAAMGVAGLAARIAPNSGFAKMLSTVAPIASTFMGGGGIGDLLKGGKLGELAGGFKNLTSGFEALKGGDIFGGGSKIFDAFKTAQGFLDDQNLFNTRSSDAHRQLGFGDIFGAGAAE